MEQNQIKYPSSVEYHKAQCWVHCSSYYSLTTYQLVLNARQNYLQMTVSFYRNMKTIKDCQELQNDLYKLTDWEQKWGMAFHPDKCNSMQVTRSRNPLMFKYSLKGQDLEFVNTGVDLSNNLSSNSHIDRTAKKANSMLEFLGTYALTTAILRLLLTKY